MKFELSHIAIACPNMTELLNRFEKLSLKVSEMHEVSTEKVKAAMIPSQVSSQFRIELLEATSEDSPIAKFLSKKSSGGIHHLSFEVEKLETWKVLLEKEGFEIIPPGIRKAARGKALFIHPKSMGGVLVELEEIATP